MRKDQPLDSILDTIGRTPIVRLGRMIPGSSATVFAKIESFNPMGSTKDRIALGMIEDAEKRGALHAGSTIVEPTSGNTGVGLAMVAAVRGYRLVLTMPETMSVERRRLLRAMGAEVVLTPGELGMKGAVEKAAELVRSTSGAVSLNQFVNSSNPETHSRTTAAEIVGAFDSLDAFVAGVGTGGTITGVGKVLKDEFPGIRVVAVEPSASAVLSGNPPGAHGIQGIGAGFIPGTLDRSVYDSVICVTEADARTAARNLARKEGILAGISSGAALSAAMEVARDLGRGKSVLVMLPDTGERYLSTDLFEEKSDA